MLNQKGVVPLLVLLAVGGLLIFLLVSSTFSFQNGLFASLFQKSHSFASGPVVTPTPTSAPVLTSENVSLVAGLNPFSLSVSPVVVLDARALANGVVSSTNATQVKIWRWEGDHFTSYTPSGSDSNNFTLEVGRGYFIQTDRPGMLTLRGTVVSRSPAVNLVGRSTAANSTGWTLIGLPTAVNQTSASILESLSVQPGQNFGLPLRIVGWAGDSRLVAVKNSTQAFGGVNFSIDITKAYFVYVANPGVYQPNFATVPAFNPVFSPLDPSLVNPPALPK